LGLDRVAGIFLCIGLSDPASDETEALQPARRLTEWVEAHAPAMKISAERGDGNKFGEWYVRLLTWATPRTAADPLFVLNVHGGMKPVPIGALLGLEEACASAGAGTTEIIYYRTKPTPAIEQMRGLLPGLDAAVLELRDYLALRGWRERPHRGRERRKNIAIARRERTAALWDHCTDDPGGDKAHLLRELSHRSRRDTARRRGEWALFEWSEVERVIDEILRRGRRTRRTRRPDMVEFAQTVARLHPVHGWNGLALRPDEVEYLSGKWLEEHVFNRIFDLIRTKATKGTELALGLEIQSLEEASPAVDSHDHEIDVALYHRNLLHLVSCKTSDTESKGALSEITALKGMLGGVFGRAALVVPQGAVSEERRRQARQAGVDYLTGSSGLDTLCANVADLLTPLHHSNR
jgi:hypothetical protein